MCTEETADCHGAGRKKEEAPDLEKTVRPEPGKGDIRRLYYEENWYSEQ